MEMNKIITHTEILRDEFDLDILAQDEQLNLTPLECEIMERGNSNE